jgi:uncharacterized protein (TIGR02611 family)
MQLANTLKTLKRHGAGWLRRAEPVGQRLPRPVRRVLVGMAGGVLVVAGAALLFLPGPGLVTIAIGVAVLATEFEWARRLVRSLRSRLARR